MDWDSLSAGWINSSRLCSVVLCGVGWLVGWLFVCLFISVVYYLFVYLRIDEMSNSHLWCRC